LIIGVGVDLCSVPRLTGSLERTENLATRLFHPNEIGKKAESLAARFAAKEALAKAIGDPKVLSWSEIEVIQDELGKPSFVFHGATAKTLSEKGDWHYHLSLSHDAELAQAFVVVESN
jgi:holo-[acyl-carrier protein] synthase